MNPDIILLAAGASTRMGAPKQLLAYQGQSLIRAMCEIALESNLGQVVVVLGANKELIQAEIADLPLQIAHNPDWETGMAGSIQTGLEKVLEINPQSEAIIIILTDQPHLSAALLQQLAQTAQANPAYSIIATEYADTIGVPALFTWALFPALQNLAGQEGAKKVILQHASQVQTLPFPAGSIDLDTPEDYEQLLKRAYL